MTIQLGNRDIEIHIQPLNILSKYAQTDKTSPEAGGIILGKILDNKISITKLSIPTQLDRASRSNFERHKLSAQIVIEYEHANSNGQLIYLGEWHTHPESNPTPSGQDLTMITNQFKSNFLNVNFCLLMIRGTNGLYLRLVSKQTYFEKLVQI
jgi:integrative and conjugative element protein (TIGR02256 family)